MIEKEEYEKVMQESKMRAKRRPIHLINSLLDQMEFSIEGLTTEIKWIRKTVEDMERDISSDASSVDDEQLKKRIYHAEILLKQIKSLAVVEEDLDNDAIVEMIDAYLNKLKRI